MVEESRVEVADSDADADGDVLATSQLRVIAIDYDGTLTRADRPEAATLDAVRAARHRGLRVVLVTGRILAELRAAFPDVDEHFDAIVAENGGVLSSGCATVHLGAPVSATLMTELHRRGVDARAGDVLIACSASDEHVAIEAIRSLGLETQLVRNRGELMLLPPGVNKGSGLSAALAALKLSRHNTAAVGDAENDHSLFDVAEVGIAVANAVPSLKERADLVLDVEDGPGIGRVLTEDLLTDRLRLRPSNRHVTLGTNLAGDPVLLPAAQVNILIAGGSGDGKSHLAGLLGELLIDRAYSLLVVDPEGDHVGLGVLPGVLVVGGDHHLPPPAAIVPLLRQHEASVVVDISGLDREGQDCYLRELPAQIEAHRRSSGLPHWVFIDEAHRPLGRAGLALDVFDPASKGYCLITWQPEDLSPQALMGIDVVLALTTPKPTDALVGITAAVADLSRAAIEALLAGPVGEVVLASRGSLRGAELVRPDPRRTAHFRHEHKYRTAAGATRFRFHFRDSQHLTGATAGNLDELEEELVRCHPSVVRHHCLHHDLSRWVSDVFHDERLGARLRIIEARLCESSPGAMVELVRLDLIGALQDRLPH